MRLRRWTALAVFAAVIVTSVWAATQTAWHYQSQPNSFTESTARLNNPDRGFYSLNGYRLPISPLSIAQREDAEDVLELLQINLSQYRDTPLNGDALQSMRDLLEACSGSGVHLILRFLYDWDGEAQNTEPDSIDTIVTHIRQLAPILQEYSHVIFSLQGLLTGNWGEMNGSSFGSDADLRLLSRELWQAAGESTFLAVRVPAAWRRICGTEKIKTAFRKVPYASRLGLFNDGILANSQDCGTYAPGDAPHTDALTNWNRAEELQFQEELCKFVPNGGEVILNNPWNDLETAIPAFRTMHITYLNRDYDTEVLEKWANTTVTEEGPYQGMDGLTYMDRHLGYRYLIDSAEFGFSRIRNAAAVTVNLKNVGFAPTYTEKKVILTLRSENQLIRREMQGDLRSLTGGNESGKILCIREDIPLRELADTKYQAYLQIMGAAGSEQLFLANEQEPGEDGYYLGTFSFVRRSPLAMGIDWLADKR